MKPNTLIIVGLAVAGIYLLTRVTGQQAFIAVSNAEPISNRLPASALICPPGQYAGTSIIGRETCLPIGAVS